jgi:hypothetical protein
MLYSISAMTSFGHAGIYLDPHWQMMGALEALNGMMLFGLTTAFLFCQWRRDFPQKWRRKIPQSGGFGRSAVWVIGASVFWRPAAAFQGRRNGIGGGVRLEADRLGQEVGVLAQPIA